MTLLIFALLGGVVGGALLQEFGGFVLGATLGALASWLADIASRVRLLERRLEARQSAEARGMAATSAAAEAGANAPAAVGAPSATPVAMRSSEAERSAPLGAPAFERAEPRGDPAPPRFAAAAKPAAPSALETLLSTAVRWFTTGNVPVKVGVVLSLFGVGFLVKEGMDREWFVLPLEYRLMFVALFGIALLVIGWRLRSRQPVYALSVQGGGIGVLYLTIFASFRFYELLPAGLAAGLLIAVTVAAGVLAVLQDARSLAVLGALGGFLAPVLVSTGSGNHVALFSYYALLNVGVVGVAWFKAWRLLNVLGFVFTFGVGGAWGYENYRRELFATTEPFLVLFTLLYLAIPVLFATRQAPQLRGFVDGTLMFGTPIVAFGFQHKLVEHTEYGLALSAIALAAIYVGMGTFLYRRHRDALRVLVEAQLALAVAFVTVAVPLALDARWTSAAWALQGAALVWLGFRQNRRLALAAGLALQLLSGAAYVEQNGVVVEWPVLNGYCLGAALLAFAGFFSGRLFDSNRARPEALPLPPQLCTWLSIALLVWGGGWWFVGGFVELERYFLSQGPMLAAVLLFTAATAVLAAAAAARVDWPRLAWLGVTLWPVAALGALFALLELAHPAARYGWLAWPGVVGAMLVFLRARDVQFPASLRSALHATAYWLAAGLLVWEVDWQVGRSAGGVWPAVAAFAVGAALVALTLRAIERVSWPFRAHAKTYRDVAGGGLLAALVLVTLAFNVESNGASAPLPYLPILNPLELVSAFVLLVVLKWLGTLAEQRERFGAIALSRGAVAALAAWFLVTMTVARSVHHFAGVPYDAASLMASTTFQGALSIVWGGAGLAAMLVGARTTRRSVWLAGAVLMTVVVAKLFLVDLGNTGTWARVVSFLGVGVLLLVVGYFAPVPPRTEPKAAGVKETS